MPGESNQQPVAEQNPTAFEKRGFLLSVALHACALLLLLGVFFWPKPKRDYRLVELLPLGQLVQGDDAQPEQPRQAEQTLSLIHISEPTRH